MADDARRNGSCGQSNSSYTLDALQADSYRGTVPLEASETAGTPLADLEVLGPVHEPTFGALRSPDFRVFWYGALVYQIALSTQFFAIGLFVLRLARAEHVQGRPALYAGVLGLAISLPSLLLGIFAGVVMDRVDRRKILLWEQSVALLCGAGIAALVVSGAANFGWVLIWAVITGAMGCFGRIARHAILPGLVGPVLLTSAVVLNSSTFRLSFIVGPAIGGFLIGPLGVSLGGILIISASVYVVSLLLFLRVPPQRTPEAGESGDRPGMGASIRAGLVFMREKAFVRWQLLLLLAVTMLANPLRDLLIPYASEVLHKGDSGAAKLGVAYGIGGVVALVAPLVGARLGRGRVFVLSCLGTGSALVLFGVQRSLVPAFILVLIVTLLMMSGMVLCTMITQLTTPDGLLGRVLGAQLLVVDFAIAVGTLLLGGVGSVIGIDVAMTISGVLLTLVAVLVFTRAPVLRAIP